MIDPLHAVSPIDGRYRKITSELSRIFSEFALIKYRLIVEVKYLKYLIENKIVDVGEVDGHSIDEIIDQFSDEGAREVKEIEARTSHDVDAVVRYLKARLEEKGLSRLTPYVHIGLTSEDVNNIAQSLMLRDFRDVLLKELGELMRLLARFSYEERRTVVLGRTHGQPAAPTTLGKEISVHLYRLLGAYKRLRGVRFPGKVSGSVGTYAALVELFGEDADEILEGFVRGLGLEPWLATKQILPHDDVSRFLSELSITCMVLVDLARDLWMLSMLGYLRWTGPSRVGSSTLPHKVNPIEVENAEGNLELASTVFSFLANRLLVSRLQRDLSDSTLKRNYGTAAAYMLIGVRNLSSYMRNVSVDSNAIRNDLESHPESLSETVQIRLRKHGVDALDLIRGIRSRGPEYLKELREVVVSLGFDPENVIPKSFEECIGLAEKIVLRVNNEVAEVLGGFE